ncbi:HMG1/2-like protein [Zingiber officinale]|uniref:HMG1/2-like protein n=1 Tax=Zingiber officinale TaxID=94328 RepID=UPI001C4BF210|nr:HMG1/2-like protein [Zingiber officinale]
MDKLRFARSLSARGCLQAHGGHPPSSVQGALKLYEGRLMLLVKKGPERAAKKPRKSKVGKDPNMPKRPQSAFFVFMLLAGGDKWKSLTEEEKAPYIAKAAKLKADYTKTMAAYNKGQSGGGEGSRATATDEEEEEEEEGEESDKSKSEVNDDDEDDEEEEDEEDDE